MEVNKLEELIGLKDTQQKMNVIEIPVPRDVNFISEWKDYSYPQGHCIVDKTICGCGYTEFCLRNDIPTILLSPRKALLENKERQHNRPDENGQILYPVYYFRNEKEALVDFDNSLVPDKGEEKNVTSLSFTVIDKNAMAISQEEKAQYLMNLKMQLSNYLQTTQTTPKILVTYDSLPHVLDVIGDKVGMFSVVVDEFQSLFSDSVFKPDVEMTTIDYLKDLPNVLYLSATPMMDRYLGMIDYFKSLPMYKLIWDNSRTENIRIDRRVVKSIITECTDIIQSYKNGIFPEKVVKGKIYKSKEAVFFVNSVKTICDLIRKNKLNPSEVNILCSHSPKNLQRIKKLGKGFDYGTIPLKGEYHKMFTFCTRTTYLGADFYSTNAITIICSDINIDTLNLDIALDLPQIVGRQRLPENVFRNEIIYIFRGANKGALVITKDQFLDHMKEKMDRTSDLLYIYDTSEGRVRDSYVYTIRENTETHKYKSNFVGIQGGNGLTENYLVILSECRAYEISRPEYQDKVIIKKELDANDGFIYSDSKSVAQEINDLEAEFRKDNNFERRMRLLCDFIDHRPETYKQYSGYMSSFIPIEYQNYLELLSTSEIRAVSYREVNLKEKVETLKTQDNRKLIIVDKFPIGSRWLLSTIKNILRDVYASLNISKSPKASDITEYLEVKDVIMNDPSTNKKARGYEILKVK